MDTSSPQSATNPVEEQRQKFLRKVERGASIACKIADLAIDYLKAPGEDGHGAITRGTAADLKGLTAMVTQQVVREVKDRQNRPTKSNGVDLSKLTAAQLLDELDRRSEMAVTLPPGENASAGKE